MVLKKISSKSALMRMKKVLLVFLCSLKLPAPIMSGRLLAVEERVHHYSAQVKKDLMDSILDSVSCFRFIGWSDLIHATLVVGSANKEKQLKHLITRTLKVYEVSTIAHQPLQVMFYLMYHLMMD